MPITSHQVGGMIGGQQAMFGNFASYSQQISPMAPQGSMPTYSNPMQGAGEAFSAPPPPGMTDFGGMATGGMASAGNWARPAFGAATLAGSMMLPGMAGRAVGALDPFSAGLGGMIRGSGLGMGVTSEMGLGARLGAYGGNMGRIAQGGLGSIARAGIGGLAGAAAFALPAMAIGGGIQYAAGKMVEGAQFQNQVGGFLQQNFRQQNPGGQGGFGFSRGDVGQISDTMMSMGNREIMSSPQEMRRIMERGVAGGHFSAVQDAKEFQKKFKDLVGTLKEVAKTMSTSLEGAMPFLQESKRMGFWTAGDITRGASLTKGAAINSGLSAAATQQMMGQGADMARSVGAAGITGAQGMAKTLGVVGGGLRSGVLSEQQMSEATGGLQGSEAVASMAGTLQAGTTRFASSGRARWLLAAMANKGMTGLDSGKMGMLTSGAYSLGDIRGMAESNVAGRGADFVMGEKQMRGDLIKQGPEAQLGLVRMLAGGRLFGKSGKDKLITQRMIERYLGVDGKQASAMAELARNLPQIMRENQQRTDTQVDQEMRNRDEMMSHSFEGVKRKMGDWWSKNVSDPLNKMGSSMSRDVSRYIESKVNSFWGAADSGYKFRGASGEAMKSMQQAMLGDASSLTRTFGAPAGGGGRTVGLQQAQAMGTDVKSFDTPEARTKALESGGYTAVAGDPLKAVQTANLNRVESMNTAAQTGVVSDEAAKALGFEGKEAAQKMLGKAREEMRGGDVQHYLAGLRAQGIKGHDAREQMARDIRSGKLKAGKGLQDLVSDKTTAGKRLMTAAAGDEDLAGTTKAIGFTEAEAAAMKIPTEDFEEEARTHQDKMEQLMREVGTDISPIFDQIGGSGRAKAMGQMLNGEDPAAKKKMEAVLTAFADGDEKGADELLKRMSNDDSLSDAQKSLVSEILGSSGEKRKNLLTHMGAMGKLVQKKRGREVTVVNRDRMHRLQEAMGANKDAILASIKNEPLKAAIKKTIENKDADPNVLMENLKEITLAAQGMDPKDVAKQMEGLQGLSGAAGIASAAGEGVAGSSLAKTITSGKGDAVGQLNRMLGGGAEVSPQEMKKLRGKGAEGAMDDILKRMDPSQRAAAQQLLTAVKGKDEKGILEASAKLGGARTVSAAVGGVGAGIDLDKIKSARAGVQMGALGSAEGQHGTLQSIDRGIQKMVGATSGTENVKENPHTGVAYGGK